ncbi:hypothetical protein IC582_025314 [Cucumis melo]
MLLDCCNSLSRSLETTAAPWFCFIVFNGRRHLIHLLLRHFLEEFRQKRLVLRQNCKSCLIPIASFNPLDTSLTIFSGGISISFSSFFASPLHFSLFSSALDICENFIAPSVFFSSSSSVPSTSGSDFRLTHTD